MEQKFQEEMAVGTVIVITSGKGGTGKTSLAGGVGSALALQGKRVLCIDGDVGLRNLDITLGMTDAALMDFSDVISGRCELDRAVAPHPTVKGLALLTAPITLPADFPGQDAFRQLLDQAREEYGWVKDDERATVVVNSGDSGSGDMPSQVDGSKIEPPHTWYYDILDIVFRAEV